MALADMLFVDSLEKSGVEYNFAARRIYPLFVDLKINFLDKENFITNLKKVVRANYIYCLRGDDSCYRELLRDAGSEEENLEHFKEKFMPFFVEDFHWYYKILLAISCSNMIEGRRRTTTTCKRELRK